MKLTLKSTSIWITRKMPHFQKEFLEYVFQSFWDFGLWFWTILCPAPLNGRVVKCPARFSPGCCCTPCSNGQVDCNFFGSMRLSNFGAGRKLDICNFQQGMWCLVWECGWGHNEQEIQNWAGNHLTGDNLQSSHPLMNRNTISTTTSSVPPNPYIYQTPGGGMGEHFHWKFIISYHNFLAL